MKLINEITAAQAAAQISGKVIGKSTTCISGINEMNRVESGDIVFVDHPKYYDKALKSAASVVIINKEVECPANKSLIVCDDPFSAYKKLVSIYTSNFYSLKSVGENCTFGEDVIIHPGVYIGNNVHIGNNVILYPNVCIYDNCTIGNNVIIHAGSVIGAHAFYYKKRESAFDKLTSIGSVVIEDDVEIGALCTVDKGVSADTRIGKGTKIDNHVHIGHDTLIGKMCLFAAQVGISGAVIIEDNVTLWGQVGIPSKIRIGKGAVVLGQSGVMSSIEGGKTYFGSPAQESKEKMREIVLIKKLPEIIQHLKI